MDCLDDTSGGGYTVELVRSINNANQPFYAYLLVSSYKLAEFRKKLATESLELADWGVVLAAGLGHEPAKEVHDTIILTYSKPYNS